MQKPIVDLYKYDNKALSVLHNECHKLINSCMTKRQIPVYNSQSWKPKEIIDTHGLLVHELSLRGSRHTTPIAWCDILLDLQHSGKCDYFATWSLLDKALESGSKGSYLVKGCGNRKAEYFVIGDYPNRDDIVAGKPFSSKLSQNIVQEALLHATIGYDNCYFTYVIKIVDIPRMALWEPPIQDIQEQKKYLLSEIRLLKPEKVILMGRYARNALAGMPTKVFGNKPDSKIGLIIDNSINMLRSLYYGR